MNCPECGAEMVLRQTAKFVYPNGSPRRFYGCSRYPECRGIHGAHPNGKPLGIPGNAETKQWRIKAHEAFDGHCAALGLSRKDSYLFLQSITGLATDKAHIAMFDIDQCKLLIDALRQEQRESRHEAANGVVEMNSRRTPHASHIHCRPVPRGKRLRAQAEL